MKGGMFLVQAQKMLSQNRASGLNVSKIRTTRKKHDMPRFWPKFDTSS